MAKDTIKLISQNKKAYHDYFILETYQAGIVPVSYTHLASLYFKIV